jgi:hypothetical protein
MMPDRVPAILDDDHMILAAFRVGPTARGASRHRRVVLGVMSE